MILETIPQIASLSPRQKLALAGELWDEFTAMPELFPVCQETVALLEARYADHQRDPSSALSWDEFRKRFEPAS